MDEKQARVVKAREDLDTARRAERDADSALRELGGADEVDAAAVRERSAKLDQARAKLTLAERELESAERAERAERPPEADVFTAGDGESQERGMLRERAIAEGGFAAHVQAVLTGSRVTGAVREYGESVDAVDDRFDLHLLRDRAAATIPSANAREVNQAATLPQLMKSPISDAMGIFRPAQAAGTATYPRVTTGPTATTVAAGATAPDTPALAISGSSLQPLRSSVFVDLREEDRASMPDLRATADGYLYDEISDLLDAQAILGNPSPAVTGIVNDTDAAAVTDASAVMTFASALQAVAAEIDGIYASTMDQLSVLLPIEAYRLGESTFPGTTLASAPALNAYMRSICRSWMASAHLPDDLSAAQSSTSGAVSDQGIGIVRRGPSERMAAVQPVWSAARIIEDPYSRAPEGEVRLTIIVMSNFVVADPGAYSLIKAKTA